VTHKPETLEKAAELMVAESDALFRRMSELSGVSEEVCRAHFKPEMRAEEPGGLVFRVVLVRKGARNWLDRLESVRTWQHDEFR
jgi:hypothetical protein